MDIKELENYRLSDAVKFNDTLNPRLWGSDENLLPEVREKLLAIANDFREFLGVPDLRVQDITVSGSNAAYTYTPHSDIDLHLVVDLPEDAVYRELFDAKKYQYNTQHNIKIAGYDVELYVQPAGDTHHSQGIYSVKNGDWISVPQRRHPDVDDISVQSKYEDIGHRIEQAIESGDLAQIVAVAKKVKQMRQAGLDQTGEFGPENLAFKALRSNGTLDQLRAALQAAQDRQLSLDEEQRNKTKKKHHYGRVGGMWLPGYEYMTTAPEIANESQDRGQVRDTIKQFARSCFRQYGLKNPPKIRIQHNPNWSERTETFGRFDPDTNTIELAVTGRHMLDILRTLAHELTHAKQNEQGEMPDDAGRTGSPYEDDANAQAGRMMRHWAEQHPDQFKDTKLDEATGYIPVNSREARDPRYSMALTVDIKPGEVQRQAAKMGWKTDAAGRPPLLMAFQNQLASSKRPSTALTENVETIAEGATDVLYHMTSTRSAANILADGVFKLASSVGTKAEEKYAPPDRPYFLSTSRSKAGDYSRSVGTSAVMFDLNGQWLAQRYQVKPIDYWDRAWLNNPERTSESEDRVFSKDPEISIACVTSVHALIKTADEWRSPYTRQVLLLAKQRGIPAFLYTDPKAWKLQDTRNAVSPQQASALLKGSVPVRTQYKPASSYLEPWLELIHKKAKSELSPKAEKLRYNLVYYGLRYPNEDNGLADDMNNSRKPDSPDYANVDKLIKFMRANRMAKPADLKNALAQKWDAINTKEQASAKGQQGVAEDTGSYIPPVLYHATYKQRLKSIQLKGLGAAGKRNWTDSKRGVVYLALDPNVAESYAETALDDLDADWDIVILKISTSGLDTTKFQLDRNVLDNEGDTLEYHGIIPPGNISLYKQGVTEDKSNRPISISKSVDGGSLEGYVIDSSAPNLTNYLHSQGASDDVINNIKSQYTRIAILRNMSVDEDNRGQGLGNYLVSNAIENAAYNGAEAIVLVSDTGEDNQFDLTKWYEGFGFEIHGSASGDPVMVLEL